MRCIDWVEEENEEWYEDVVRVGRVRIIIEDGLVLFGDGRFMLEIGISRIREDY